jgi:hypothetical protein
MAHLCNLSKSLSVTKGLKVEIFAKEENLSRDIKAHIAVN